MVEAAKWVLLGACVAFALQWVLDRAAWAKASKGLVPSSSLESLQNQLAAAEAALAESASRQPAPTKAQEPVQAAKPANAAGVRDVTGPTEEQFVLLGSAGLDSIESLAGATEDQVLAAIGAQPWDSFDVADWIGQAKTLSGGAPTAPQTPLLHSLPLTPDQLASLDAAGVTLPGQIAAMTDDELLEALGAQPWDMVDVDKIRAGAKELV